MATGSDDHVGELYLEPPAQFVAARDEKVRAARAAGDRELARGLHSLRRPTQSAWLVNLLAHHDRAAVERLLQLGRDLRDAQERMDGQQLRRLAGQRHELVAELVGGARRRANEAGLTPSDEVLAEVEGTLQAALADPAAAEAVGAGRLTRPMTHTGFGPAPDPARAVRVSPPPAPVATPDVEQRKRPSSTEERRRERERAAAQEEMRRAEEACASAESAHQEEERELAEAESAVEAARQRWEWLEQQRAEARREKAAAERRLSEARAAQRSAARSSTEARRVLDRAAHRLEALEAVDT
jgi:DNA repair exonuclease SbcCD ATPase subunit